METWCEVLHLKAGDTKHLQGCNNTTENRETIDTGWTGGPISMTKARSLEFEMWTGTGIGPTLEENRSPETLRILEKGPDQGIEL